VTEAAQRRDVLGPVVLGPNQPWRFYRGGAAIAAFRGLPLLGDHFPEDWVASTTELFGDRGGGPTTLPDGELLRDRIAARPLDYLGPDHVERFGADPQLLVKLLDAGQRLPVHAHPDRAFSHRELGLENGKTEAWIVLGATGSDAAVYVGFRDDIEDAQLRRWVADHDSAALLGALNRLEPTPGDVVYVPAGAPHAIGAGMFILELQEPTDLSVMLEWEDQELDGDAEGHLGIGFERALGCVDRSRWSAERLDEVWSRGSLDGEHRRLLPEGADAFFRAELVDGRSGRPLPPDFAVLVVTDGEGTLRSDGAAPIALVQGQTVLVPHAAGTTSLEGGARAIRCLPPSPHPRPRAG
jgi:mannose-6-phosphate isomerase